jgi:hypothetical protein
MPIYGKPAPLLCNEQAGPRSLRRNLSSHVILTAARRATLFREVTKYTSERLTMVETQVGGLVGAEQSHYASAIQRFDSMERRMARIERRLDLTDTPSVSSLGPGQRRPSLAPVYDRSRAALRQAGDPRGGCVRELPDGLLDPGVAQFCERRARIAGHGPAGRGRHRRVFASINPSDSRHVASAPDAGGLAAVAFAGRRIHQ